MPSSSDSSLLNTFLFHLRTPLYSFKSASQVASRLNEKMPVDVLNWFEKWSPSVELWISEEEKAHSYKDGKAHDWEQIVFEMAENMKDLSVALSEGKALELPESTDCKRIFELALHGIEYLNNLVQPLRNRDYQFLLQK